MNRLIILIAAMLSMACVANAQSKNDNPIDMSIEQVDKELDALLHKLEDAYLKRDSLFLDYEILYSSVDALKQRLEHYLLYPQTFENDMPLTREHMSIVEFPQMGHKIYNFWYYEGGTMGYTHENYIQYRDKDGELAFVPFYNDLRYPMSYFFTPFNFAGNNYYFVTAFFRGSSCSWSYYCAIITIEDGVITHHPEFFPEELNFKPEVEEYFIYDDKGKIVDNDERPCYFFLQCLTDYGNKVSLDFDPVTLTVTVEDEVYNFDLGEHVVVKNEWRLNTDR
jgi:hypothetical protein